jgi:hypothetical protein
MNNTVVIGMLCGLLGLAMFVFQQLGRVELKVEALRLRLDAIAEHLKVPPGPTVPTEVAGLLQAGRKIEAIKVYRAATGAGLAEAKAAVERMQAEVVKSPGPIIEP